jgi:hypothetical protein
MAQANYQHVGCPHCGWHRSFPGHWSPAQINHAMHVEREQNLNKRLDQTGATHDAKRLLAQRRRRPGGLKPIWAG